MYDYLLKLNFQLGWDLCVKLARLWTHNPEYQGSSPIQVGNLIAKEGDIQNSF